MENISQAITLFFLTLKYQSPTSNCRSINSLLTSMSCDLALYLEVEISIYKKSFLLLTSVQTCLYLKFEITRMLLFWQKPMIRLLSSSRMRLSKKDVPCWDCHFAVLQFAAVGVYADRQSKVLPRFYVLCIDSPHLLDITLDRGIRATLLNGLLEHIPQKQSLDNLIAGDLQCGFRQLLIKRQSLILNDMVIEKQRSVCLQNGLQRKLLGLEQADVVLQNFSQEAVDLLLLLYRLESLLDCSSEYEDQTLLQGLVQVFHRLDIDQQGRDYAGYFEGVHCCEVGDYYVGNLGYSGPSHPEAEFLHEELDSWWRLFDRAQQIHHQHTDAFQKATIFRTQNIHKQLIQMLESVGLLGFYLQLRTFLFQESFQAERRQYGRSELVVRVGYLLIFEQQTSQLGQKVEFGDGGYQFVDYKECEFKSEQGDACCIQGAEQQWQQQLIVEVRSEKLRVQ